MIGRLPWQQRSPNSGRWRSRQPTLASQVQGLGIQALGAGTNYRNVLALHSAYSRRRQARSGGDAREIDGVVRIRGRRKLTVGDWAEVKITAATAYDLEAKLDP